MKTGIAGIGGIGSNVARHLAQARIHSIKIVDFDCVEISNLNRQFYRASQAGQKKTQSLAANLGEIHPDMIIEPIDQKIHSKNVADIFADCPIIVEGFDDKYLKKMMVETFLGTDKIIVSASGIAGENITNISVKKMGNCHIIGDFVSDQKDHPLFPPKISIIAARMADLVLKMTRYAKDKRS